MKDIVCDAIGKQLKNKQYDVVFHMIDRSMELCELHGNLVH